jgi:membrane dipeptidase
MGLKKNYKGYKAYDYLTPGVDYNAFDLVEVGDQLFPQHPIELNEEQEARVLEVAEKTICISLHDHPNVRPKDMYKYYRAYCKEGRGTLDYEALSRSYWDCIFDNMLDGGCNPHSKSGWKWTEVIEDLGKRACDVAHQDMVIKVEKVDDIYRAYREGKLGIVFVIEGAGPIENELDRIDILYGIGIRQMGVTYSESNYLGTGCKEPYDGGLTVFGRAAVERMNKVGMLIDVSHSSDQTMLDVIKCSSKPIIISHVGAKGVWNSKRMASDEVFKACAAKGGVIGIEAAPHTTVSKAHPKHNIYSVMDHFEYVKNLVGIDHVSFGTDVTYADHCAVHKIISKELGVSETHIDCEEVKYVAGIENPTEASHNIIRYLVKQGYSDEDISKVMGGNALRVLKEVWA